MPCYSPLKGFKSKENGGIVFKRSKDAGEEMEVNCSQCLGCRLDRSRMWATRIVHEASLYDDKCGNSFITLTYDDDHLPDNEGLTKSDFQKFIKRLRKEMPQKIRYFMCGEYGDHCEHGFEKCKMCGWLHRPHYHAILFNCSFPDLDLYEDKEGYYVYTSPQLEKLWGKGFVTVGDVTFDSAAYVASYCVKKITGLPAKNHYTKLTRYGELAEVEPEYATMSRRPGIGKEWFDKYGGDVFPSDEVPVVGKGIIKKAPRYYDDLCERAAPDVLEEVKRLREIFRREHEGEYTAQRLMDKYKVKKAQLKLKETRKHGYDTT